MAISSSLSINYIPKTLTRTSISIPKPLIYTRPQNPFKSTTNLKPKPSLSFIFKTPTPKPINHHHQQTQIKSLFTGIVEEMGQVKHLGFDEFGESFDMVIHSPTVLQDVNLVDNIVVNGTCLTVSEFDTNRAEFKVGLAPETLRKTSLNKLEHVDGTWDIVSMEVEGDYLWVKVKTLPEILKFVMPKGFIAVDEKSLTVVTVFDDEGCFDFMLVEYTQQKSCDSVEESRA